MVSDMTPGTFWLGIVVLILVGAVGAMLSDWLERRQQKRAMKAICERVERNRWARERLEKERLESQPLEVWERGKRS